MAISPRGPTIQCRAQNSCQAGLVGGGGGDIETFGEKNDDTWATGDGAVRDHPEEDGEEALLNNLMSDSDN
jgi:hypothetical protein